MKIPTSGKDFNNYRDKKNGWIPLGVKGKFLHLFQNIIPFFRDDGWYNHNTLKKKTKLEYKILRDTYWLGVTTYRGKEIHSLTHTEQVIKYYEYRNMIIQQRAQYVIIFLTISLLLMTSWEIYLKFFTL